jgi:hypothetical protein
MLKKTRRRHSTLLQGRNSNSSFEEEPYLLTAQSWNSLNIFGGRDSDCRGRICRLILGRSVVVSPLKLRDALQNQVIANKRNSVLEGQNSKSLVFITFSSFSCCTLASSSSLHPSTFALFLFHFTKTCIVSYRIDIAYTFIKMNTNVNHHESSVTHRSFFH